MKRLWLALCVAALSGCSAFDPLRCASPASAPVPSANSSTIPVAVPSTAAATDADWIVDYATALRRMSATELQREHEAVKQNAARTRSDQSRMQLALIYALPGTALRDPVAAQPILDSLAREGTSPAVRNFAPLLTSFLGEVRRLDESAQVLSARLKEEQKVSAELQQKLEALKSIERSISDRDRAKPTAPK